MDLFDLDLVESNCRRMFFEFFLNEAFKFPDNRIFYNEMSIYDRRFLEAKIKYDDVLFEAFVFERLTFKDINLRERYIDVKVVRY